MEEMCAGRFDVRYCEGFGADVKPNVDALCIVDPNVQRKRLTGWSEDDEAHRTL